MREINPISMENRINELEKIKASAKDVEQINDDILEIREDIDVENTVNFSPFSKSVNGNIRSIKLVGNSYKSKNLVDVIEQGDIGSTGNNQNNSSTKHIRTKNHISVKPNITYTLSYKHNYIGSGTFKIFAYNSEKNLIERLNPTSTELKYTFTTDSNTRFVRVAIYDDDGILITEKIDLMLNEGTEPLPYEPYGLIIPSGDIVSHNADNTQTSTVHTDRLLASVNDLKNEIVDWKFRDKLGIYTFDGTENWTLADTNDSTKKRFSTSVIASSIKKPSSSSEKVNAICDRYDIVNANDTYGKFTGICSATNGTIYIYDENHNTTLDDFENYLKSNPVTIIYELANPTVTDLSKEEVAELLSLKTYEGQTYIDADGAEFEISYFKNTEIGQSIADLQSLILNLI